MELREIIKIFKKHIKLFCGILVFFVFSGTAVFFLQPNQYSVNLMLNVTRKAVQQTQDYRYDDFYRLQADERFADTVVRWLGAPQIVNEIYRQANVVPLKTIKASRLSSQMIEVVFVLKNPQDAQKIATATAQVLNKQTESLDQLQKEETWFALLAGEPAVAKKKISLAVAEGASILLGLFFGAWGVMIVNYLKRG